MRPRPIVAAGTALLVVLTACGGEPGRSERIQEPGGTASPPLTTASPSPSLRPELAGSRLVRFASTDGVELVGRLWGEGKTGVVLAHGFDEQLAQGGWYPVGGRSFPTALARRGYLILTFNFRGFTDEDVQPQTSIDVSNNWRDAIAAVRYIRSQGARRVFLIGASMGGIAALRAARATDIDLDGVVSLATPQFPSKFYADEPEANDATPERLKAIEAPLLFIAGKDDVIEGVRFANDAQRMFEAANEPKEIAIVDSRYHSSGLVTSAEAGIVKETTKLIVDFIEEHS